MKFDFNYNLFHYLSFLWTNAFFTTYLIEILIIIFTIYYVQNLSKFCYIFSLIILWHLLDIINITSLVFNSTFLVCYVNTFNLLLHNPLNYIHPLLFFTTFSYFIYFSIYFFLFFRKPTETLYMVFFKKLNVLVFFFFFIIGWLMSVSRTNVRWLMKLGSVWTAWCFNAYGCITNFPHTFRFYEVLIPFGIF